MLIRKIFHVGESLEKARAHVSDPDNYVVALQRVHWSRTADQATHLELVLGRGVYARVELKELPTVHPNQNLFRAVGGDLEVMGMVEFFPIREHLTEVEVTLDCTFKRALPRRWRAMERFVEGQLRRIAWALVPKG